MKKVYLKFLKEYVLSQKVILWIVFAILLLQSVSLMIIPFTYQQLIDEAFPNKDKKLFILMVFLMLGCYCFNCVSNVVKDFYLAKLAEGIVRNLRIKINSKISRLQYSYFDSHNISEILSKYNKELETIKDNCGYMLIKVFSNILTFCSAAIIIACIDWKILIFSLLILSIYFLNGKYWGSKVEKLVERSMECNEESINALTQNYRNALITKLYSAYSFVNKKFEEKCNAQYNTQINLEVVYSININSGSGIIYILSALIWLVEGIALFLGRQTIGSITALINYQGMLITPLAFFAEFNNSYKGTVIAIERIMDILSSEEEIVTGNDIEGKISSIKYQDVNFQYLKNSDLIIEDANLLFEEGTISALIGGSGCGKSSLIKLLLRLYPVASGNIQINGQNLNDITLKSLRKKIALVSQESLFFNGTIWENLKFGDRINEEELEEYSKLLGIYDEIMKMPEKWNTVLNENTTNLSGGQKKRLDILRALLLKPDIIIFDESTASIDLERRKLFFGILEKIKKGKILILITHNIEECQCCDYVYAVKNRNVLQIKKNNLTEAF